MNTKSLTTKKSLLTLIALFLIALATYYLTRDQADTTIIQSQSDSRSYRYLELPNELRVLLISDPNTDKAAASLDVYVGSRQDPNDYQGLAHFLEHMLFLGTEKYPDVEGYQRFIHAHNGRLNAYTSFEHTNYFFDINPDYLQGALDRFAQFFIAPLFNPEYVEREKNAVHAEYFASIKHEGRRYLDVLQNIANPLHPFSKFYVGNLDTLQDDDQGSLRKALLAFYDNYYSANIMALVVLGKEPLDALQALVEPLFSAIPNHHKILEPTAIPLFNATDLPLMVNIQPEQEQRSLEIIFPLPSALPFYEKKPLHYVANLLGHEGEGSLLSALKSRSWAEKLTASTAFDYQGGALFSVKITLTQGGLTHIDQIIPAVFQAINRIKNDGIQPWLFAEQKQIAHTHFRYQEQIPPIDYVMMLANAMQYYPASDIIIAPYVMSTFDAELIESFLSYLTPDNSVITITAPDVNVDTQTKWYAVPYQVNQVDQETRKQWNKAGINPAITIPEPNAFIATDFVRAPTIQTAEKPLLVIDKPHLQLWFKHDDTFQLPKGNLTFALLSDQASDSPRHRALLNLLATMVMDDLNEMAYPARLAGLHYTLTATDRGLLVQLHGFTDKQTVLLDQLLRALQRPDWNQSSFARIKTALIRDAQNVEKEQPYRYLMNELPTLLIKERWPTHQLLPAYQAIDLKALRAFSTEFLHTTFVQALVYGNYSENDAKQIGHRLQFTNEKQPDNKTSVVAPAIDIVALPNQLFSYGLSSTYEDGSILWYLQGADTKKSTLASMEVTAQLLRVDFFKELRTEKQLGYVVTTQAQALQDVPGIFFLIQSPIAGPAQLRQEILAFIEKYLRQSRDKASDFERHRQVIIQRLLEAPKNQSEQAARYWADIEQGYLHFDSREQFIEALEKLTFQQWLTFFQQQIAGARQHGLLLYTLGQFTEDAPRNTLPIGSVEQFKTQQAYYN